MKNRAPKRARMRRFQKCAVLLVASLFTLEPEASKSQVVQGLHQDAHTRTLAITFDDLPGAVPGTDHAMSTLRDLQRYNRRIINILTKHHVPAIGFVNETKLQVSGERDVRAALLDRWLKGGLDLGNHTYSHVNFDQTSLEQFEDETVRGEVVTRALLSAHGKSERYFRHPALSTGPTQEAKTAFQDFLKSRGYRVAPVTVEKADYEFNDVLSDAIIKHERNEAEQAKTEYLAYTIKAFRYVEVQSEKLFGREIPQVLLIHDNEINSEVLDTLLTGLESRGYRFVPLDDVLADPAYGSQEAFAGNLASCYLCWNNRLLAVGKSPEYEGVPIQPSRRIPIQPPEWVTKKFAEIRQRTAN